ncbi:M15 family metallopeptidase [Clostridium sp. SYSU_GA19001]|nr:M15 family metallopeptidase [Clostridium caldaquaticum]MCM8709619.1 M15 family metallopeptidase [Clostridium caldaquaticum]
MKRDLLCLMLGYPEYAVDVKREDNGNVYLIMKSGKKILYDDKKNKTFEQKLNNPDLQDMMEQIYPLKPVTDLMEKDFDPGRIRVYELLREVYGGSKQAVEKNLVNVSYINCRFNGNNKAAESLKNVMKELVPLAKQKRDIGVCVYPLSGTYNYRTIAGTGRLSPHAFGNTIDLARDKRDYWRWTSPEQGRKRLLSYPKDIVEIFEKNNFVWGGKWNHFDILHFEYRPEIILKAKFFGDNNNNNKWYSGAPIEELSVKSIIEKIDKAFN